VFRGEVVEQRSEVLGFCCHVRVFYSIHINTSIELSIKTCQNDFFHVPFAQALKDAVSVHNACPHSATGESPFGFLFGQEPVFPGWQAFSWKVGDDARRSKLQEIRCRSMIRAKIGEEYQARQWNEGDKVKVGDWILFPRGEYERKTRASDTAEGLVKYKPWWSLPAKVVRLKKAVCHVSELGNSTELHPVPLVQVLHLEGPVPPTLAKLNVDHIKREALEKCAVFLLCSYAHHLSPVSCGLHVVLVASNCCESQY
jgi:hypothetical protein